MKSNRIFIFSLLVSSVLWISCGSDSKTGNKADNAKTETSHKGHDHSGHDHSGHDHSGHDHSGHDHSGHDHAGHDHSHAQPAKPGTKDSGLLSQAAMDGRLPNPCTLLQPQYVKDVLGLDYVVSLKNGSKPDPDSKARSCFFRWTDPSFANSAILIQVLKDPMPEEGFENWAFYFVDAKKASGEVSLLDPENPIKLEPYNDLGDTGAASDQLKKYYWQVSNKIVFMIAYNMDASGADMRKWTKKLGTRMMENFNKAAK